MRIKQQSSRRIARIAILTSLIATMQPTGVATAGPLGAEGDLYVLSYDGSTTNVFQHDGANGALIATFTNGVTMNYHAYGLTFDAAGDLYVAETEGPSSVLRFNGSTGAFISTFAGGGGLSRPVGMLFQPNGNLLVAGYASGNVVEYDANGQFVRVFASGNLASPFSLGYGPNGNVLVTCRGTDDIRQRHPDTGADLGVFCAGGATDPLHHVVGPDGAVYLSDYGTSAVYRFDGMTGAFLGTFVSSDSGGLSGAFGMAHTAAGNLLVCSYFGAQVLQYNGTTGAPMGAFTPVVGSRCFTARYKPSTLIDCNGNQVDDAVDIAGPTSEDCDEDDVPNECETDGDGNGTPDECEVCAVTWDRRPGLPGTNALVFALADFDDGQGSALYAAGGFSQAGGVASNRIAKWDGASWSPLGSGLNSEGGRALAAFNDDPAGAALYVGGVFTVAGTTGVNGIARWDGTTWSDVGGSVSGPGFVWALLSFDDGSGPALYAGGRFSTAGSTGASFVARWNGVTWSALGGGQPNQVRALAAFDDGGGPMLIAGRQSGIGAWDGATWSDLGTGINGAVFAVSAYDDGGGPALYAAGSFSQAGGVGVNNIAKWQGGTWSALGAGTSGSTKSVQGFDDGFGPALYAGGNFSQAGGAGIGFGIARWQADTWVDVRGGVSGDAEAMIVADFGEGESLYVGGQFTLAGGAPAQRVARWGLVTTDCNSNGVPDSCDLDRADSPDCNTNDVPDECDIAAASSDDCDGDGTPDECEPDCNQTGIPDDCDIAQNSSADCNDNGIPDECDPDCNGNSSPDDCDIAGGSSSDCNSNDTPDDCEPDCNGNSVPDDCDIAAATSEDCNANTLPDECDTAIGPGYGVTDVGTLGGSESIAYGISGAGGRIVGQAQRSDGYTRAFLWHVGVMTDLGTLGGSSSLALASNSLGQVVGRSETAGGNEHPFLWDSGVLTDLGTLGGASGTARGINDAGQVVGGSDVEQGYEHAFLWDGGAMTDLGTLGGDTSNAYGINSLGQIVGGATNANGDDRAFLWDGGIMTDLGVLPDGQFSVALDINESGQIVGYCYLPDLSAYHGFLYENGVMTDLGTLVAPDSEGVHSFANAINNAGTIVGSSNDDAGEDRAFVHDGVHGMRTLNDLQPPGPAWDMREATGVDELGRIVGWGYNPVGDFHGWLAHPGSTDCDSNVVPDECDDCNTNGTGDHCDTLGGTSQDICPADGIPDECQTYIWIGPDGGSFNEPGHWSIGVIPAGDSQIVVANSGATDNRCVLDSAGETAVCSLSVSSSGGGDQTLEIASGSGLRVSTAFENAPGGVMQVSALSQVIVDATDVRQSGELQVRALAGMAFDAALTNSTGGLISLLGGALSSAGLTNEIGAIINGTGWIDSNLANDGDIILIADTLIAGNLSNEGTIMIQNGILTITGSLSGSGTIIGGFGGRDGDSTGLTVHRDFHSSVSNWRQLDLTHSTLHFDGDAVDGPQRLEVMGPDRGAVVTLPDATLYSIGTLRIGPSATTVRLLDRHDNKGAGSRVRRTREAMYVQHLILDPGVTLDLAGLRLYYETVSPDDPSAPNSGVSVIDSVGGGELRQVALRRGAAH